MSEKANFPETIIHFNVSTTLLHSSKLIRVALNVSNVTLILPFKLSCRCRHSIALHFSKNSLLSDHNIMVEHITYIQYPDGINYWENAYFLSGIRCHVSNLSSDNESFHVCNVDIASETPYLS